MNRLLILTVIALLFVPLFDIGAQERGSGTYRTCTWSLYGEAGATMSHGIGISNVNAAPWTSVSPEIGAGVSFNIRPWIRLGLNYDFSKYARELRFDKLQTLGDSAGDGTIDIDGNLSGDILPDIDGSVTGDRLLLEKTGGLAYTKMWTQYHAADLTLEFNVMEIWKNRTDKRFNLYAGAGFGWLFARGNTYNIAMGNERWKEKYKETTDIWLKAENTRHNYNTGYVPMLVSAEFDVSPIVTLGLQGNYKRLLKCDNAPKGIGTVSMVVRLNLLGGKSGYKSKSGKLRESENALAAMRDMNEAVKEDCEDSVHSLKDDLADSENEVAMLKSELEDLKKENEALKSQAEEKPKMSRDTLGNICVMFDFDSSKLRKQAKTELDDFASKIKLTEGYELFVTGEASASGDSRYNLKLSELRIGSVISHLSKKGIDCSRAYRQPLGDIGKDSSKSAQRVTILIVSD